MQTLKQQILDLPENEMRARRAFYSDKEWEESWELNAFPFQLPPMTDDWTSWTIIGGRGVGKTEAGYRWALDKFQKGGMVACIFHHLPTLEDVQDSIGRGLLAPNQQRFEWDRSTSAPRMTFKDRESNGRLALYTEQEVLQKYNKYVHYSYIWADEVTNAGQIMQFFPLSTQYTFSQPVVLPKQTILSRAGDQRIYS